MPVATIEQNWIEVPSSIVLEPAHQIEEVNLISNGSTYAKPEQLAFCSLLVECIGLISVSPLMPEYVFSRGENMMWVGAIFFVQSATSIVGAPIMGMVTDWIGPKRAMLFCILVDALIFLASGFIDSVIGLFILRAIAGGVIVIPSCQAYLTQHVPAKQRRAAITRAMVAGPLGYILGYCVGGFVSTAFGGGKRGFTAVCCVNSCVAFGCALFIHFGANGAKCSTKEKKRVVGGGTAENSHGFSQFIRDRKFASVALATLCMGYVKEVTLFGCGLCSGHTLLLGIKS
jgi:MFS family permease